MNKIKHQIIGKQMFSEVRNPITNNILIFSTNNSGRGLWISAYDFKTHDCIFERKQIEGIVQFSIEGLRPDSRKAKMRKHVKRYLELYFDLFG